MLHLTADDLRQAFAAATRALERHREAINALNVFPVPDGDTGTNMLLTMRSAMEKCPTAPDSTLAEVAGGLADGAFWGARGNSGVILSQFFKGFAEALEEKQVCRTEDLARSFSLASDAAYQAVGQPVEGTMLTVIRSLSSASREYQNGGGEAPRDLWGKAFRAGQEALDRTPEQLPVLREAGVVDAGGMGVVVIMGGALAYLNGSGDEQVALAVAKGYTGSDAGRTAGLDAHYLDSVSHTQWGYCTQFVITGEELAAESIRQQFVEISESAVVVGGGRSVRVHVHAPDPGPSLSLGASMGQLNQIDIQNMNEQNREFAAALSTAVSGGELAVVAVASGDGLDALFREVGCAVVVNGGQTMNPSVRDILEAVESAGAKHTIILPNNKNVIATAEQVMMAKDGVHVVPSDSVPRGVAAMLAFNPEESAENNLVSMNSALAGIVTIEVTKAARPATVDMLKVAAGQYISLLEGKIVAAGETPEQALESALALAGMSPSHVVTLYIGAAAHRGDAEALSQRLEQQHPGIQVDLVDGGQPHYHYLASVE
jgi:DAK2 domain fusion protein YloV